MTDKHVTIAILAKDKSVTLPLYLYCILSQTFPKSQTSLYIRTNDNTDNTTEILKNFVDEHGEKYKEVYFNDEDINSELKTYNVHEWNNFRFKILGKIRQDSIDWAKDRDSWYFVIDCDNFINPNTLESLINLNLPTVAPLLQSSSLYSNYHYDHDVNGYLKNHSMYHSLYNYQVLGIVKVSVIHCTYLIRPDILKDVCYDDESYRYEYVIFSDALRKKSIPQYIDNRDKHYGFITFATKIEDFKKECITDPKFKKFLDSYCSLWSPNIDILNAFQN
jgi:hypothetical protein